MEYTFIQFFASASYIFDLSQKAKKKHTHFASTMITSKNKRLKKFVNLLVSNVYELYICYIIYIYIYI